MKLEVDFLVEDFGWIRSGEADRVCQLLNRYAFWVRDLPAQTSHPDRGPGYDPGALLAGVSRWVERVDTLGVAVYGLKYWTPALIARQIATLEAITEAPVIEMGLGSGDRPPLFLGGSGATGFPFDEWRMLNTFLEGSEISGVRTVGTPARRTRLWLASMNESVWTSVDPAPWGLIVTTKTPTQVQGIRAIVDGLLGVETHLAVLVAPVIQPQSSLFLRNSKGPTQLVGSAAGVARYLMDLERAGAQKVILDLSGTSPDGARSLANTLGNSE